MNTPRRPDEVPHVGLVELVEQYGAHVYALLVGRPRIGDEVAAAQLFDHALAALALAEAVADRLRAARWSTVRDALAADAGRGAEVAAAVGLELDEVAVGLRRWADGQREHGLMTARDRNVVRLLARGVRA